MSPWPPTGIVVTGSPKPAISGRAFAMAALTDGSVKDAIVITLMASDAHRLKEHR